MKLFFSRRTLPLLAVCLVFQFWSAASVVRATEQFPEAVRVEAPDGLSTPIFSKPNIGSEPLGIALQGDILESRGVEGDFVQIRVPGDKKVSGYVLKEHTVPWEPPKSKGIPPLFLGLGLLAIIVGGVVAYLVFRVKKTKEDDLQAASIPASIRRAEELYRAGDFAGAIREFKSYIELQGGEVRNPDVYRRLTVCYQNTNEIKEASRAWETMRSLGGLKNLDDYALGVELMSAQGREAEAADIYEQLLQHENDEDKRCEIHKKLFEIYRRIKNGQRVVDHAAKLKFLGTADTQIIPDTIHYLIAEGQTDVAIASNNKELVTAICSEFLEDKARTPDAARIYLKALEYDRTDQRLHRILADIYHQSGDLKRAVNELTILHQLDKDQPDVYMEEAAKLYVDNGRVSDAIAEGNPLIIKKIAQTYLAKSEVNPAAVAIYEKVLEFQPKAVGINRMLSTVYLTRGDLAKYMEKLRLLHEIDGKNHDYLSDLAKCVIDNNMIDETVREGNRELNAKIMKQLIKQGTATDKAVNLFEKLIKVEPDNLVVRGALAKAYEKRSEPERCFEHVLHVVRLKPDDAEFAEKAATLAVDLKRFDDILELDSRRVMPVAAREIIKKKLTGKNVEQILTRAVKEAPDDSEISDYLASLSAPASKKEPASESKSKHKPEPAWTQPPTADEVSFSEMQEESEPEPEIEKAAKTSHPEPAKPDSKRVARKSEKKHKTKPEKAKPEPKKTKDGPEHKEDVAAPAMEPIPPDDELLSLGKAEQQFVRADEFLTEERAVTTFVSGHSRGRTGKEYSRDELLLPTSGGLAYKEMEVIATDGWGNLHVGMEVNTGRPVLLRVFRNNLLEEPAMNDFVSQVAELGFTIVHENILPLEEVLHGPGGSYGLVHPFFSRTLEGAMRDKQRPDMNTRLELVGKLLDGMAHAHHHTGSDTQLRRTFHLQLQSNLIFVSDEYRKLQIAGLGYCQIYRNIMRGKQPRWQDPGMNPAFMPPEFFRSKSANAKEKTADIYAIGVLIYHMATGEFPFEGPSFDDYKFQHIRIFAAPPRLIDPSVPDWLEPIILGCLEKEPEKRWNSIAEIQQAFNKGMKR